MSNQSNHIVDPVPAELKTADWWASNNTGVQLEDQDGCWYQGSASAIHEGREVQAIVQGYAPDMTIEVVDDVEYA